MHTFCYWVTDRIRFLPVIMTGRFSNFNSISYTEDRHKLRVTGMKCRLPDTMSGTGEIFISGADIYIYRKIPNVSPGLIEVFKHFLGGLYSGGLTFGGAYIRRAFCVSVRVSRP